MVSDFFGIFLEELGKHLKINNLKPDRYNSCLIKFLGDHYIQIEVDKSGNYLIIGCDLGEVVPGKYRENLFYEALKANNQPYPRYGFFAYSKQQDHLILMEMMALKELNAFQVAEFIPKLLEKAKIWKEAIARGGLPSVLTTSKRAAPSGIFGL